ncbi:unnamed protein product [Vitrella brassicaformis CCMP3155]|uniref:Uncharacterized protein n=1 Tax=Vitrella brassicaformis (strain CCMP3155) TaxID=1169540 RepID=A0A0G4ERI5_VITBC|nr:unnamed protein product [Vitrella brassicaformis CCMP3155]|eukprot:CEM00074.1 unnamed protein product [Vitrella brassicaformis CCMP3155]
MRQVSMCRFLLPVPPTDKADQAPQQRHADTDFTTPEAQAIADEIITQRQLASPPPNASLCGFQPGKLADVCEHMYTHEAIRLALLSKSIQDTSQSPFVIRHLNVTPESHKLWRKAQRSVLGQLRGRLTRLETASIITDEDVYSRGLNEDRLGDEPEANDDALETVPLDTSEERQSLGHGHRSVYARLLEASAARLKECHLLEACPGVSDGPGSISEMLRRQPRVTFESLHVVEIDGSLWAAVAYSRLWRLPSLKVFVSSGCHPQLMMRWLEHTPHLAHCEVETANALYFITVLRAVPSLKSLTSLGVIDIDDKFAPSLDTFLRLLEDKGAIGRSGHIESLSVLPSFSRVDTDEEGQQQEDDRDVQRDRVLAALRALAVFVDRIAGSGISAGPNTQVTAIPRSSWYDKVTSKMLKSTAQSDSTGPAASSSTAAADNSGQTASRKAPLFPNMVPRGDADGASTSQPVAEITTTRRPFQLLIYMPPHFDDKLLRLDLKASDVLPKKIVREMARAAEVMAVEATSSSAASGRGSFGDYVFDSLAGLQICDPAEMTDAVLPLLPDAPCSRFPRLQRVFFRFPSFHLIREGGVRQLLSPVKGQLPKAVVFLIDAPSRYDTNYGTTAQPPAREAAPGLLAQLAVECLEATGQVDEVELDFMPVIPDEIDRGLPHTSPFYHLYKTPSLMARLPTMKHLTIDSPYCIHGQLGNLQIDFIMAVITNTHGLQQVTFSERMTGAVHDRYPNRLQHYPAYLASAAVDETLASAGSPFVVVSADDTTLTLKR